MNKALIIIKSPGIGDLQILLSYVHELSKKIGKPVSILAQKTTGAKSVFKNDKHVDEVIDHMANNGYLAGIKYSDNQLLIAVTEKRTKKEIDKYVELLNEVLNV